MPIDAPTWEETADAPTWEDTQTDLSGVKPSPYEAADIASIQAGRGKARTGMEPGTELTEQLYGPLVTHPFQTAARVVAAPIQAAGGMIASALNLVNPQTWVPESQKTDKVFGESPQERAQRHEREQFGVGRPILTPTGTSIDPEGSGLARLLSQWSTPEQAAMLPAGLTRAGAVAMITQMVPQAAQQLYETATGQGTDEEKRDRINNLFSMGVMMAHGRAGTSKATSRLVREAKADVRERLELPAQEREAFAGRDWTKDIDYHALSRDLAIPGATVMQRPSVVPPEGVVSPVGPMERIPVVRPPRAEVPGTPAENRAVPTPEQEQVIEEQQQIKTIRASIARTKAEILALFQDTNRQQAAQLRDKVLGKAPNKASPRTPEAPQESPGGPAAPPGTPPPVQTPPRAPGPALAPPRGIMVERPAAGPKPAAPGTIGSLSDEQWEAETERITDMVDADNPARESGRINYELNDAVDNFMRYAREQHPDKTIWDAFKAWADEEGADLPTLRKLRSILKDTTAAPTAPKESALTPAPPEPPASPGAIKSPPAPPGPPGESPEAGIIPIKPIEQPSAAPVGSRVSNGKQFWVRKSDGWYGLVEGEDVKVTTPKTLRWLENKAEGQIKAQVKPAAEEFRRLVQEHGITHGWIQTTDVLPDVGARTDTQSIKGGIRRDQAFRVAYKRALKDIGLPEDSDAKNHAAALPKLKAYLAEHANLEAVPLAQLGEGSKFTYHGDEHTVGKTDPETGTVRIRDGRNLDAPMEGAVKVDPGSVKAKPVSTEFLPPEEAPKAPKLGNVGKQGDLLASTQTEPLKLVGERGTDADRLAAEKAKAEKTKADAATLAASQQPQLPGTGTGEVMAFGGAVGKAASTPIPPMPQRVVAQVQQAMTPGLNIIGKIKQGFASLLLPSAKSPAHLRAAELLGQFIGRMHQRQESAADQLKGASRFFDRMGLEREGVAPAANPGTKFRSDVSMGRTLSPGLQRVADLMDKLFSERLDLLEAAQAPLKTIRDNYFPGIWTMQSRLAFNAALEELIRRGTLPKDIDLNAATPAQRDAVKALTDDYLKAGKGSDNDMLPYLTKRPLAGRESFRKQKVFEDIMHAEQFGLRPVSYNPIDLVKVKLAEMDRSIMMHEYVQALKGQQELKIINPYEEVPKGWQKLDDRYGIIYGKPTVTIPEYIDKAVYEGLVGFAKSLGIKHVRSMKFPPGPGQSALGLSYQGQNLIRSRFATETSVIAHEIGHQLDYRYDFWDRFVDQAIGLGAKGTQTKGASQHQRGIIRAELRKIADLTGSRGGDPRKKVEQIAQMVEAYVHSPEKMKQVAPTVHQVFDDFIKSEPSLKALADIKPGIELTQLTGEKYVGLPIMGYRIVPDAHGDIINNYLSKSLYNNQYFGTLYKGWIGAANSLNQTQLGMGSAFHGGFTTIEAMVSSGANVLKDVYGVLRGNRTVGDLATTAANSIISVGRNPVIGNRVLNAWRERNGTIDPKIAQVVKAMEVAGGGLKLEHGMMTEQTVKMLRNYYSGQYLQAAARSPVALTELMAKPIMEYLVPRQKAGVFAEMAWRVIEQNPGKTAEELAPEFRQAWNRVDARLGQVRYDRLFMRNTAKNVVQALVRAPGWSGGTITEIGGGFTDAGRWLAEFARTGRLPDNLPDRTAYVLSLLTGVMTANGVLTYAFTGQKPTGMDFWAFRTGGKDDYGNEERFVLPSYLKDILAYARHPGETLMNKSHPLLSMFGDLSRNKDYYGVEIRGRGDPTATQAGQTAGYIVKSWEPFWIRGFSRERARGAGAARQLAPLVGVMPAPRSVTQTPAESLAHDLMLEQIPAGPRTRAEAARAQARSAATRGNEPYLEHALRRLRAPSAVLVLEQANPEERRRIVGMVNDRIANSRTLSDEEKDALSARVNRAGGE